MKKYLAFIYGIVCYAVFLFSFLYAIGFVGNIVVPKAIDSGPEASLSLTLFINLVLLGLFAAQHTVMARPGFKLWWTRIVPKPIERSTFVLIASLLLILLYWQWRPMTTVIWSVDNAFGKAILAGLFWLGWCTVLASTFMINHFDLFGLRQVYLSFRDQNYHHVKFANTGLYSYARHPIMLGFIVAFWASPHMTAGHLMFAIATTAYTVMGIQFEERDLINLLGQDYEDYRQRVPMLIPFLRKRDAPTDKASVTRSVIG